MALTNTENMEYRQQQELAAEAELLRAQNKKLREALAFAVSVIKSGEPWTETCEKMIRPALG